MIPTAFQTQWNEGVKIAVYNHVIYNITFVCFISSATALRTQPRARSLLSVSLVINHVTCDKFDSSYWLKLQYPDWREYFNQFKQLNLSRSHGL